ncbi:hypothetical protein NQ317_004993 [Molorchus minor]|uniref:Uncharacterized protein n=1 Tax=Molorchus minor TaxID=1323400 RepID=A0ABQ9K4C2_9CUCU|nr:hypothetical protein NQ317_004993 [Molorchus minor]
MGKLLSKVSHPFKNFNLESRAHNIISQPKPTPAPRFQTDEIDLQRLMKEYPEAYKESLTKNEELDKYLKSVYVTSKDVKPESKTANPNKPLPTDRRAVEDFIFGVKESINVPEGKITLKDALEFITQHQNEPKIHTSQSIAERFKIPEETTKHVLKYFKVFQVYIPQERNVKAKFAGPSVPKITVIKHLRKELPPPTESKDKT